MGTTVTTNLNLIKPDIFEKIKEDLPTYPGWADQNADNCDQLDGLFRKSTHTYTPAFTADSVNPTLGTGGSVEGKYIRVHPRMVVGYYRLFTGTTGFATGTGLYQLSLPAAAPPDSFMAGLNDSMPVGKAYLLDNDVVANATVLIAMYSVSNGLLFFRKHDGGDWRNNAPFTLAQSDRLSGYFMYPTAAA